jgi:hypothetical protein
MRAPRKGAAGACRRNRRQQGARPEWVRPYRRAQRALDSSVNLISATMVTAMTSADGAQRRPLRTVQKLSRAMRRMVVACLRLAQGSRELAVARECLRLAPEAQNSDTAEILDFAAERCQKVAKYIHVAVHDTTAVQLGVLAGLATGQLVPERPSDSRPRIILKPRPIPVRAFLAARQPRVADRITPVLRRRRRIPPPASIRVPRPSILGRAPPFSSTCLL